MNVAELRKAGWKVRVSHYRYYLTDWNFMELLHRSELGEFEDVAPEAKGGLTEIELTTPAPECKTVIGISRCSTKDNFNRKYGVVKALGRAMANLQKLEISN